MNENFSRPHKMHTPNLTITLISGLLISSHGYAADTSYLGMFLPADFQAFDDNSLWNTKIPDNAKVDPKSAEMIQNLISKTSSYSGAPFLAASYKKWTAPMHVIYSLDAPKIKLTTTKLLSIEYDPNQDYIVDNIPMPAGVWADPSSDGHMILVDPIVRMAWEFSRFKKNNDGTYQANGVVIWKLNGDGWRQAFWGDNWWTFGAIASGLPIIGGIIRPEEIKAGAINHALLCGMPSILKTNLPGKKYELCSPIAARTDGQDSDPNAIPMGARLQLDPSLDLNTLPLSEDTKIVARCMQQYGLYVGISSINFKIFLQNLSVDGAEWKQYNIINELPLIPLKHFRVLECNKVYR